MCGIWALFSEELTDEQRQTLLEMAKYNKKRGPDDSKTNQVKNGIIHFDRLAINGLDEKSMQPFKFQTERGSFYLLCNGEIYNHKELSKSLGHFPISKSDCEIIGWMYNSIRESDTLIDSFRNMVSLLDGVFSFIIYDEEYDRVCVARDRFGVRPLYYSVNENTICFGSTLSSVHHEMFGKTEQYPANSCSTFSISEIKEGKMLVKPVSFFQKIQLKSSLNESLICRNLRAMLENAVEKRLMSDRKICCLLSGGLDSSLITSIVCKLIGDPKRVDTYSIGLPGSPDCEYAQKVADFLGTNHKNIIVDEQFFLSMIPEVIENIESYDTTSVRASVGNYLIAKFISEHSDNVVVFNGDGSDELFGGYMYFHDAPGVSEYHQENMRLLTNIHFYDVLRSDRSISSHGLEPRTPFLDHDLASFWLSIHPQIRMAEGKIEKYLLRKAFSKEHTRGHVYLPNEILWRKKEAFSDGVSKKENSWHSIIQKMIQKEGFDNGEFDLAETNFYYHLFVKKYPYLTDHKGMIPELWLPRWTDVKDPSARNLQVYEEEHENDYVPEPEKEQEPDDNVNDGGLNE